MLSTKWGLRNWLDCIWSRNVFHMFSTNFTLLWNLSSCLDRNILFKAGNTMWTKTVLSWIKYWTNDLTIIPIEVSCWTGVADSISICVESSFTRLRLLSHFYLSFRPKKERDGSIVGCKIRSLLLIIFTVSWRWLLVTFMVWTGKGWTCLNVSLLVFFLGWYFCLFKY